MKYDYIGPPVTQNTHFILDVIFDPADDHEPWIAIKVYRDGNPIDLARFATEQEADDFIADLKVFDGLFKTCSEL